MILGLDYDVENVHAVLLDDDTNAATYHQLPIADKRGSFYAAGRVRCAFQEAPFAFRDALWSSVWLAGIEEPYCQSRNTLRALSRVQGAILASLPRDVTAIWLTPHEWKRGALGEGHAAAGKEEVAAWAAGELSATQDAVVFGPQDAFDAYAIARAIRARFEQGELANARQKGAAT